MSSDTSVDEKLLRKKYELAHSGLPTIHIPVGPRRPRKAKADPVIEHKVGLIRDAIDRIKIPEQRFREVQGDPHSDSNERDAVKDFRDCVVREFRYQWPHVEAVLDSLSPVQESTPST